MPFALQSMEPHCPTLVVADTPEEAWAACDARGLPRDRALVLPCARTIDAAAAAAEERDSALLRLEYMEDELESEKRKTQNASREAFDANDRADAAEETIVKAESRLRAALKRAEKVDSVAHPRLFGALAGDALRDALKILKGESLDAVERSA